MKLRNLLVLALLASLTSCFHGDHYEYLQRAEELTRQNKLDEAITLYRKHIDYRLSIKDRAEWENPYFYLLQIGDLQLQAGKVDEALKSFELAEENKVDAVLISDRYRYVASIYEKEGKLEDAINLLTKYRDRDPLLYDLTRDRIAKELVMKEDAAAKARKD